MYTITNNIKNNKLIRKKRAQVAGQIFIYIIAIVITSLILVYGYTAIKDFRDRGEQVDYINLKNTMENNFKSIVSDFGSIKRPDLSVPNKYRKICFVEIGMVDLNSGVCKQGPDYEPIVCSGWRVGNANLYFVPDGSDAAYVGPIAIKDAHSHCFNVTDGRIKMQIKSLGDTVEVCDYSGEAVNAKC